MFTGIVEELGRVRSITPNASGARLEIEATRVLEDVEMGASIAVNGCCLTVVSFGEGIWECDAIEETLRRTCLGALQPGDRVNLERPVRLQDRLGGHLVQGHVDATGQIVSRVFNPDESLSLVISAPEHVLRYTVEKGSITVDGISLTVARVGSEAFGVEIIPHTQAVTTLGFKGVGASVNLEVDTIAKYVERLLEPRLSQR